MNKSTNRIFCKLNMYNDLIRNKKLRMMCIHVYKIKANQSINQMENRSHDNVAAISSFQLGNLIIYYIKFAEYYPSNHILSPQEQHIQSLHTPLSLWSPKAHLLTEVANGNLHQQKVHGHYTLLAGRCNSDNRNTYKEPTQFPRETKSCAHHCRLGLLYR